MVVWVETQITQGACAYPITSSTTMGGGYQVEVANGTRNLWGEELAFIEPESEHSAASTCEGFAVAGGRVTNFTSGQGLILMKEVLYTISGKRLPIVFHIGARALTSHSLNVHAGHDDVYGVADCGWGVLFARNAQEAGDLALISRRTAEESETPFLNVQDGFLTTHTIENVRLPEPEMMKQFAGHPSERIRNLMDPQIPLMSGVVQNQDSYMKGKIAQRRYYDRVLPVLKSVMAEFGRLTGRRYDVLMPYRLDDADYAIVGSGCMIETAEAAVDYMRERLGLKVGLLHVTCFRPFPSVDIVRALRHVKAMAVIERLDVPMMQSNPQLCEIKAAFADAMAGTPGYPAIHRMPKFTGGSAGLGSRDVRAGDFIAMVENMRSAQSRHYFTVGIKHETALPGDQRSRRAFARFVLDARAFGRRLWFGHHQQGNRHDCRRGLRHGRAGLSQVRVGKEGLADDLLPDRREPAHSRALRTGARGVRGSQRRQRLQSGEPADGDLRGWNGLRAEPQAGSRRNLGVRFPPGRARRSATRRCACSPSTRWGSRRQRPPAPTCSSVCRASCCSGFSCESRRSRRILALSEEDVFHGAEKSLRKYFGKRGERVVQDNLEAVRRGYHEVIEVPREVMLSTAEKDNADAALRVMQAEGDR